MARDGHVRSVGGLPPPEVLLPGDAALSLGRHPRGARAELLHHGRHHAVQADARLQCAAPHRLGRPGPARGERGHQARNASGVLDARQHRGNEGAAAETRFQLCVESGDRHLRRLLLPVESVVLPEDAGERHRLSRELTGELVPVLPHRSGQRAGRRGNLLALPQRDRDPGHGAVVPPYHRLPGCPARRHERPLGLARTSPAAAAKLGRPVGRRRGFVSRGGRGTHSRLHHAYRHHLRRDVLRPGPRTPAGRLPDARGRSGRTGHPQPAARPGPPRPHVGPGGEGGALHRPFREESLLRRTDPDLGGELRPDGLRDGSHHGRARARRARLRVRAKVWPADSSR